MMADSPVARMLQSFAVGCPRNDRRDYSFYPRMRRRGSKAWKHLKRQCKNAEFMYEVQAAERKAGWNPNP